MRALFFSALLGAALVPRTAAAVDERTPTPREMSVPYAVGLWSLAQLIPSPLLVTGREHVGFGVRWQVTPLLYSFGIAQDPLRSFVVSPIARHSGSLELYGSPEWSCCAPSGSSWVGRAGLRLYLPLLERGERLSWSLGGAYYHSFDGHDGVAADIGLYTLFGVLGVNVTVSPGLARREVITALSFRYF